MLCFNTAKAYFPDRQSCSTLCRQPFGCARSVEVVAVYPSLGSYSVVVKELPFTLHAKTLVFCHKSVIATVKSD